MSAVPLADTPQPSPPPGPWHADFTAWGRWLREEPARLALVVALGATLAFFYGWLGLFTRGANSVFGWAWAAWSPENNYEHAKLIPFITLFLLWNAMGKLRGLRPESSRWGLALVALGVLLFVGSARTLQPRVALAGLPLLLGGAVLYVWGRRVARALLFPIGFLCFMIPLPGLEQATVKLQVVATQGAAFLCNLVGLHMKALGTTLQASDESFKFEIAGGCSGINSLMAITMLTAIFVHLTQDRLWKKLVLMALSVVFAVIANVVRLTSIMAVARFFGQKFAGGIYHDWSAFVVSLPIAFGAMALASKVINWQPTAAQRARWLGRPAAAAAPATADLAPPLGAARPTVSAPAGAAATARPRPSSAYDY